MELLDMNLLKTKKFTKYYIQLMKSLNTKLDTRIEELSTKIVSEFENKKVELIKMRDELNELYKVRNEINGIETFYDLAREQKQGKKKSEVKNIPYTPLENPYRSSRNILTELKGIQVSINNGELLKKSYKTNTVESVNASEILNSDSVLSNYTRLMFKKTNTVKAIDKDKVLLESDNLTLVFDFNESRVNPSNISARYFFLPNENKFNFSFVNSVLLSNDGKNWETISSINLNELKYFEKIPIFKWKLLNRKITNQFYRYIAFEVSPFKEIVNTNQINKLANRLNIPLCGLEIFGDYYSETSTKNLNNVDEQFEEFFDTYLQTNQVEASVKTESQFLIKMILDSFREINNILTDLKSQVLVKQMLASNDAASLMMPIENILQSNSDGQGQSQLENDEVDLSMNVMKDIKKDMDNMNELNNELEEECLKESIESDIVKNLLKGDELEDLDNMDFLNLSQEKSSKLKDLNHQVKIIPNKSTVAASNTQGQREKKRRR
jgi:hypothetical protein